MSFQPTKASVSATSAAYALVDRGVESHKLPTFDKALSTRRLSILGLVLSYAVSLTCIIASIWIRVSVPDQNLYNTDVANTGDRDGWWRAGIQLLRAERKIVDLTLNVVVTICTETLAYICTASLRWALWRQGLLQYSSNLRLFNHAPGSKANSRYANILSAIALIVAYTSASQVLLAARNEGATFSDTPTCEVNAIALLALGLSLLVLSLISQACLYGQSRRILTWSSNMFDITKACLHDRHGFRHRQGRCLRSAAEQSMIDDGPAQPSIVQPTLGETDPSGRHILRLLWALTPMTLLWAIVIAVYDNRYEARVNKGQLLGPEWITFSDLSAPASHVVVLVIVAAFQSVLTLSLHGVELLVYRSRDESAWRAAALGKRHDDQKESRGGARLHTNAFKSLLTSWQSLTLLLFKPVAHFLFGSGLTIATVIDDTAYLSMYSPYLFALTAAIAVLSIFATLLLKRRRKGPIPSAWGHLQTIADLVDDWGVQGATRLYWGDKGESGGAIRHAGTSDDARSLGEIRMDQLYSGIVS